MISTKNDLQISGGCALLSVDLGYARVKRSIRVFGRVFVRKPEFHATLLGHGHRFAQKLQGELGLPKDECVKLADSFIEEAASDLELSAAIQGPAYFVAKRYERPNLHERRSIVARAEVRDADRFYARLETLSGIAFEPVPHHVTLYVLDDEASWPGIGLVTEAEFDEYATEAHGPDASKLARIFA